MRRGAALGLMASTPVSLAAAHAVPGQPLATVRIGGGVTSDITPILYGMRSGLFRTMGLDVRLESTVLGAALAPALLNGTVDIAKLTLLSLIIGHARGLKLRIVAGAGMYAPQYATTEISVLKTSAIRTLADANGKTAACNSLRGFDQLGMQALVDKSGGNSATIRFVEIPIVEMPAALDQGRVDLAMLVIPVLAAALATGRIRTLGDPYAGIGDHVLIAGWACRDDFAAANPELVRRFGEAVRRATLYTNAHYGETVDLFAEYSHIDAETIRRSRHGTNATRVDERDIQGAIDAAARYQYIDRGFPARELVLGG